MLNLLVMIRAKPLFPLMVFLVWLMAVGLRPLPAVEVLSPRTGDVLQGVIAIEGTTAVIGFESAEISFAYEDESGDAWFLLNQSRKPVTNGPIAEWDTTTIADGTYKIKVVVKLDDGKTEETLITGLRVRNYTQVEASPTPEDGQSESLPTAFSSFGSTPTPEPSYPTPTPFPVNPAGVTIDRLQKGALTGVLVGLILISGLMVYLFLRKMMNR